MKQNNCELPILTDHLMRRLHSELYALAPNVDVENIGPMGGMILMLLTEQGELSIQSIVDQLARDKSQLSKKITELEKKGFVSRRASEHDARISLISLSKAGEDYAKLLQSTLGKALDEILKPLDETEREQLSTILTKLRTDPA